MDHKDKEKDEKSLTVADVVCKWYWGAAVGVGVGYLYGHTLIAALIGAVVGAAVGFVLQTIYNSKNDKKKM